MKNVSIIEELTAAEAELTSLCEAIQRKTKNKEIREEYHTLLNQATGALNKIRSLAETDNFFNSENLSVMLDDLKEKYRRDKAGGR